MKKGDKVIMYMFTGCATSVKEIIKADKKTIVVLANNGTELVFDAKTLKQIEPAPKSPKFANYIKEDDGSFVKKEHKPRKKKEPKPKKEPEPIVEEENWEEPEDDDDFDDDEYMEVE